MKYSYYNQMEFAFLQDSHNYSMLKKGIIIPLPKERPLALSDIRFCVAQSL